MIFAHNARVLDAGTARCSWEGRGFVLIHEGFRSCVYEFRVGRRNPRAMDGKGWVDKVLWVCRWVVISEWYNVPEVVNRPGTSGSRK